MGSKLAIIKSKQNQLLVPLLGIAIAILLLYMIWDIASNPVSNNEGFTTSSSSSLSTSNKKKNLKKATNSKTNPKKRNPSPNQSKLSELKHGKYNANEELKNYGMDGENTKSESDDEEFADTPTDSKMDKALNKMGRELGKSTLDELARKGKRDNFKNVINEVDNINPGAFDLTSIGGTIRRYNENFNNRLNYAKSKNKDDNLEAKMAQGRVIFDEFKKIFLFTDMFT